MDRLYLSMIGHGAIILFFGLLAGWGLVASLIGGLEIFPGYILEISLPGDSSAWSRTHTGGILNGLMVLVFALVLNTMKPGKKVGFQICWMVTGAGYANTIFYWGGMLSANRALSIGDNRHGEASIAGILGYIPALIFAAIIMIAVAMLGKIAFNAIDKSE